jgi:hypothetical protein
MEQFTNDELLLLRYQRAHVEYHNIALNPDNEDGQYEWEYTNAFWALDELEDPILRGLAKEANAPGRRADEARQELLELSCRVKNLYPLQSREVH